MVRLRRIPQSLIDIVCHVAIPWVPLSRLELDLRGLSVAEQSNERFDTICKVVSASLDALGSEDVNLEKLSREQRKCVLVVVELGLTDRVFETLAHEVGHPM